MFFIFTMMTLSPSSESTTHLGHYGLIAGAFDELDISDIIDDLPHKKSGHNIPHSTLMKAMCINGLEFIECRLYIFPEFFENLLTERLLGEGILSEYLMMMLLVEHQIKFMNTELLNFSIVVFCKL